MQQDERVKAMQNYQNAMVQLMLSMQTQHQKYSERNEHRAIRLTKEMEALTVRMDGFQEYMYHVGMHHPPVGRDGCGQAQG